jgi:hypothetical protein
VTNDPSHEAPQSTRTEAPPRPYEPAEPEPTGPGAVDAMLRRGVALVSGLLLVVGFFLPWRQATPLDPVSVTGLDIVLKGLMDPSTRYAVLAVPLVGIVLLIAGYVGRRSSLFVGLLAGVSLILVGAWQILSYLAESIGTGLWIVAGAALLALIGGIPWQRVVRGGRHH